MEDSKSLRKCTCRVQEWDADDEKDFLKTLSALKSRDPKIYANDVRFFKADREGSNKDAQDGQNRNKSREKPMFLKDYERKLVLERGGELSDDEDQPGANGLSYHETEQKVKEELKRAMHGDDSDEDDGLLRKRVKTEAEKERDEEDYYAWLKGNAHIKEKDKDLEKLKKRWSSKDLDEDERFLRDFLLNKQYEEGDADDQIPTYEEIVGVEESEDHEQRAEEFEHKYNFRFEEPDQEFIKTYPRTVQSSLRKPESKNKEQRQKKKARKEEKKRKAKEEIRELRAMKRAEIEEKLRKLKEATGDDSVPLSVEDLEKDFDPADYDRRMHEIFAQEYYEKGDEEAEKPVFSDMSSDADSNYDEMEIRQADDEEQGDDQNGAGDVDEREEEEAADEPGPSRRDKKKKRKRNTKFREAVARQKPVFDPNEKTFDEYFKEYYALDYEDIIADDLVTKFKYRSVPANSFGLTTEEILTADDKQLNAWVSVRKCSQYRSEQEEKLDQMAYERKAKNVEKKQKIFMSALLNNQPQKKKPEAAANGSEPSQSQQKKKKRKKGKKTAGQEETSLVNGQVEKKPEPPANGSEPSQTQQKKKKRKKSKMTAGEEETLVNSQPEKKPELVASSNEPAQQKKNRRKKGKKVGGAAAVIEQLDNARLRAYGVSTKKLKRRLYGKKMDQINADKAEKSKK
ncbi:Krr1 family protein [Aphelenchoides avenae]|nr:Krr1 family protein [Aphelenchus avenae]